MTFDVAALRTHNRTVRQVGTVGFVVHSIACASAVAFRTPAVLVVAVTVLYQAAFAVWALRGFVRIVSRR